VVGAGDAKGPFEAAADGAATLALAAMDASAELASLVAGLGLARLPLGSRSEQAATTAAATPVAAPTRSPRRLIRGGSSAGDSEDAIRAEGSTGLPSHLVTASQPDDLVRCPWGAWGDPAYVRYHDDEWGVPSRDDRHLFEMLVLEGAQAGLSWATILHKRDGYRRAFDGFEPAAVAAYGEADVARLLADPGIVRNRLKVEAAIANARATLDAQARDGSLAALAWSFVGGGPIQNAWQTLAELPAETDTSRTMSRELKRRGFRFVGPTICYSFMQATGLVNDHTVDCFRYPAVAALA